MTCTTGGTTIRRDRGCCDCEIARSTVGSSPTKGIPCGSGFSSSSWLSWPSLPTSAGVACLAEPLRLGSRRRRNYGSTSSNQLAKEGPGGWLNAVTDSHQVALSEPPVPRAPRPSWILLLDAAAHSRTLHTAAVSAAASSRRSSMALRDVEARAPAQSDQAGRTLRARE